MTYPNEPTITDNYSIYLSVDERVNGTTITNEAHTPTAALNYSYYLKELPLSTSTPTFDPARTANWSVNFPASNSLVYVDYRNGKVRHHSDDAGVAFQIDYTGIGSGDREFEDNQKRTAIIEAYKTSGQGVGIAVASTKTVIINNINADIGGRFCKGTSLTADLGSGTCQFPATSNGEYRVGYIWLTRSSESSITGSLVATWGPSNADSASCLEPEVQERAILLVRLIAQANQNNVAGACANLVDSNVFRIARNTGIGDTGGGTVYPQPELWMCDANVTGGDTLAWYRESDGYTPKVNSTLKKANSTCTDFGVNCSGLPVDGICQRGKPHGPNATSCYLITGSNSVYINGVNPGVKNARYYQELSSPGNITSLQPLYKPGNWCCLVAYGTSNATKFIFTKGTPWQVGKDTEPPEPPTPTPPPDPQPTPIGADFYCNVTIGNDTYNVVYISNWTGVYPLAYKALANKTTNCPDPKFSWGPPNVLGATPPPPDGANYGIIISKADLNAVHETAACVAIGMYTSRYCPISTAHLSWANDNATLYVDPATAGAITKTRPKDYQNIVYMIGHDREPDGADNETFIEVKTYGWKEIKEDDGGGIVEPYPEARWVDCHSNVTVDDWIGIPTASINNTYQKAWNGIEFFPRGTEGVCCYKNSKNPSQCKLLTSGFYNFNSTTTTFDPYFLSNVSGGMTKTPIYDLTDISQFSQQVGKGAALIGDSNMDFFINPQPTALVRTGGVVDMKYTLTLQSKSSG